MISKISTNDINFKGYVQKFTDAEFKEALDNSLVWAKENADNKKYFLPQKLFNKYLERNHNKAFKIFENYKEKFKQSDFEPVVSLELKENELLGKVTHYRTTQIKFSTQMPCNIKTFYKNIVKCAKNQIEEDAINIKLWDLNRKINILEQKIGKRYDKLAEYGEPNPIVLFFDETYSKTTSALIELIKEKRETLLNLDAVKFKLKNKHFKLKLK